MFFVYNKKPWSGQRGENRRTCAQDHRSPAFHHPAPLIISVPARKAAVQNCNLIAETPVEQLDHLRGKGYFGYQGYSLTAGGQDCGNGLQVNFSLAAACDTMQEKSAEFTIFQST